MNGSAIRWGANFDTLCQSHHGETESKESSDGEMHVKETIDDVVEIQGGC